MDIKPGRKSSSRRKEIKEISHLETVGKLGVASFLSTVVSHPLERMKILKMTFYGAIDTKAHIGNMRLNYSGFSSNLSKIMLGNLYTYYTKELTKHLFMMNLNFSGFWRRLLMDNVSLISGFYILNFFEISKQRKIYEDLKLGVAGLEESNQKKMLERKISKMNFSKFKVTSRFFEIASINAWTFAMQISLAKGIQEKIRKIRLKNLEENEYDQSLNLLVGALVGNISASLLLSPIEMLRVKTNLKIFEGYKGLFSLIKQEVIDARANGLRSIYRGCGWYIGSSFVFRFLFVICGNVLEVGGSSKQ